MNNIGMLMKNNDLYGDDSTKKGTFLSKNYYSCIHIFECLSSQYNKPSRSNPNVKFSIFDYLVQPYLSIKETIE